MRIMITAALLLLISCSNNTKSYTAERIIIHNDGWELVGDLVMPRASEPVPAVLMLNKAAGNRTGYAGLAQALAQHNIASLRVDLRGHGESINRGKFISSKIDRTYITTGWLDVVAASAYLQSLEKIDRNRIAVVGGSYSGESMMEAARGMGFAQAYVALSPGSYSDASYKGIDPSGAPFLFVIATDDQFLQGFEVNLKELSRTAEIIIVPGEKHADDMFIDRPDLEERVALWLSYQLR